MCVYNYAPIQPDKKHTRHSIINNDKSQYFIVNYDISQKEI